MRSKGYFWLTTRPLQMGSWAQAGTVVSIDYSGMINAGDDERDDDGSSQDQDEEKANEGEGELSAQEVVFIGNFNAEEKEKIIRDLDDSLLTDAELALFEDGNLSEFEDPWEDWPPAYGSDDEHDHESHDDDGNGDGADRIEDDRPGKSLTKKRRIE